MGLFSFLSKNVQEPSSGVFVPIGNEFKALSVDEVENKSIVQIAEYLGYDENLFYTLINTREQYTKIQCIVLEVFTDNILFVCTDKSLSALSNKSIREVFRQYPIDSIYDGVTVQDLLEEGIEKNAFRCEFLTRVLGLSDVIDNGVLYSEKLKLYLFFSQGYLEDFQSSDGLNRWARYLRDDTPNYFEGVESEANYYWKGDSQKATQEINRQADAYSQIPAGPNNPFWESHRTAFGVVNCYNLMVAHYSYPTTFKEFIEVNKGRYAKVTDDMIRVGKYVYVFDNQGKIIHIAPL